MSEPIAWERNGGLLWREQPGGRLLCFCGWGVATASEAALLDAVPLVRQDEAQAVKPSDALTPEALRSAADVVDLCWIKMFGQTDQRSSKILRAEADRMERAAREDASPRQRMGAVIPLPKDFVMRTVSADIQWIVEALAHTYFYDFHDGPHKIVEEYAIPGFQLQGIPFNDKRWVAFMVEAVTE